MPLVAPCTAPQVLTPPTTIPSATKPSYIPIDIFRIQFAGHPDFPPLCSFSEMTFPSLSLALVPTLATLALGADTRDVEKDTDRLIFDVTLPEFMRQWD